MGNVGNRPAHNVLGGTVQSTRKKADHTLPPSLERCHYAHQVASNPSMQLQFLFLTSACDLLSAGQLSQVGRQFYNTDIEVEILSKEETEKMTYVVGTSKAWWVCRESDLDWAWRRVY